MPFDESLLEPTDFDESLLEPEERPFPAVDFEAGPPGNFQRNLLLSDLIAARQAQPGLERNIGLTDVAAAPMRFLEDVPRTLLNAPMTTANVLGGNAPTVQPGRGILPISAPTPEQAQNLYESVVSPFFGDPSELTQGELGLISAGSEMAEGLTDPKFAPMALTGGGALRPALRAAIPSIIGTESVAQIPEAGSQAGQASVEGGPFQKMQAYGRLGGTLAIPAAIGGGTAVGALRGRAPDVLGTAGREMLRGVEHGRLEGGEGRLEQPVSPLERPGYSEEGVPWTTIGPQRDPRFNALREEGVTAEDAAALINGEKTVQQVVGGNFKVTPAYVAVPEGHEGRKGHDEAWMEGYNQAVERLTNIVKEKDPYAIHRETEGPLRPLQQPGREGEGAREVPADVTGEATGARGGDLADQAGKERAAGREDVLPPLTAEVSGMSTDEFFKWAHKQEGGFTTTADKLGDAIESQTQLKLLEDAKTLAEKAVRAVFTKESFTEKELADTQILAMKHQFFSEAYGRATGTGSAGEKAFTDNPGFKPKFPQGEATEAARRNAQEIVQREIAEGTRKETPGPGAAPVETSIERIVATAVRDPSTGKITASPSKIHVELYGDAGIDPTRLTSAQIEASSGFVTSTGRFVTGKEANTIGTKQGLISPGGDLMGEDVARRQNKVAGRPAESTTEAKPAEQLKMTGASLQKAFKARFDSLDEEQRFDALQEMGYDVNPDNGRFYMTDRDNRKLYLSGEQLADAKREFLRLTEPKPAAPETTGESQKKSHKDVEIVGTETLPNGTKYEYSVVNLKDGKALIAFRNFGGDRWQAMTDPLPNRNSAFQWLEDNPRQIQFDKPFPPGPGAQTSGEPLEARMPKSETRNPFEMDDDDLRGLFNERFGRPEPTGAPGEFGRPGKYSFPTYAKFRTWMDERYAALDIEGMRNAFAEAPTENKIRYIKENKAADDHKRAWIANLATGAPLPKERPPVAPGPAPGPIPPQPPGTPPQRPRPAEPPPPPRTPTPYRKFDVMALTQMFRQFEKFPKVNERLTRAYGRFVPSTEAVELKARLLWDIKLAERVLGHEIGHFLDWAVQYIGKGKDFAAKLEPLNHLRERLGTDRQLREDARSLSRQWRGPFANGERYRDSANELFADYMSAMFNNPEWVNQQYPRLHDALTNVLGNKPSFREAYQTLENWLQGNTMSAEWMAQQEVSVRRTIDDLLKERPRHRESFMDMLKGQFVTQWHRAFQAEGRPSRLGTSITDELEYNASWAAKENALFADSFTQRVQPQLERVNPDIIKARTDLHSYSQARRTIGERRAAGQWIEQNPEDARTMLAKVLEIDDGLRSKFGTALDSASDSDLYDLSAAIFREVHDRGELYVKRIAREIDNLDLDVGGQAALNAFNVRGKLLNPGGLTEDQALKVLHELQRKLTPEQWQALESAGSALRDLLHETQRKAFEEGLIPAKIWNELIEPNKDNYLPYAVLDYWEGKVRAGVMPQKGTAMDIADVTVAAQLKVAALNAWRQKQRQVRLLMDAYAQGGVPIPIGERLRKASDIDLIRKRHTGDDISRAVLWKDGRPHLVEFPSDRGKTLEKAMEETAFYEHLYSWIAGASNLTHGMMQLYTTLSIPFLVYRNPVRGARTGALRVGFRSIGKQYLNPADLAHATELAKNYADAAFGAPMLPEVRQLVDQQMLLPPRLASAMVRDADNLRELLENGGILATQIRQLHGHQWPWWKGGEPGRHSFEFAEKVFSGYEAFEKIQNYLAAKARGASEAEATAIGRRAGIPKPAVGGHLSLPMEVFFPWTRVHIQGVRSTLDTLRDPKYRKGFVARFMITEGAPRLLKIAVGTGAASGAISWLLAPDEDPKDPVMSEVFRRISPYKMALDDIVPLMLYDARKGQYHYFSDFKKGSAIPPHYEVVSFRVPSSEEGRLWGVLLYQTMISLPGAKEKMARPGEDIFSNTTKWAANYLVPGISPAITTTANLKQMILEGKNPEDPYRGQPAANKQLFEAGGVDRAQAIAGYTLNQLGGPGEIAAVMAMNFGVLDPRAADALKKRLSMDKTPLPERFPLARNMFSYDNYAAYRTERQAELAEKQLRARARLVMSPAVRGLYDFYWTNYQRKNLSTDDWRRLTAASYFVNTVWGDLKSPRSFYARAAHAIGPDGSARAKETVRRDLDAAAATALARFSTR